MSLIGRADEFAALTSAASDVKRAGRALVLEGDAGIGKTTMLNAVAQWAGDNGFTVLSCAGVQCQAKVGYAAVHELFHPLLGHADALPVHQRRALLAAFGMGEDELSNPLLIGVAMLGLVEEAAAQRPLMLIVDDAQWLDGSSLHVLTFVGRRLANAPVMLLGAARPNLDGEPARLVSLTRFPLGPVDEATSRVLLADALVASGEPVLGDSIQRRILNDAGGNPLAITELTRAVAAAGDRDVLGLTGPLPTTRRIERVLLEQLDALPESSRRFLALIAAADDPSLAELVDAALRVGLSEDDLDPLERNGLLTIGNGIVRVRHPLIRSVAYGVATLSQRASFHRALADVATDPMRAAWQRAAGAHGPDETIAAELEAVADAAQRRGANDEAAAAMRRSADLSPSGDLRVRRLAAAVMPAYRAGLTAEAIDVLDEAEPLASDPRDVFELAFARYTMGITTGVSAPRVSDLVTLAHRLGTAGAVTQQLRILAAAAAQCRMHGMDERSRHVVAEALHALEHLGDPSVDIALATVEDTKYARHFRDESERLRTQLDGDLTALMAMGLAAESVSDLATAQQCWADAIRVAHDVGAPTIECEALRGASRAQLIAGQLHEAAVSAQGAFRIATDANLSISAGAAAALLARAHAWRGEVRAAEQALATARQHLSADTPLIWVDDLSWAAGLLALTVRDYPQAFAELAQMSRDRSARRWAIADLTEAGVGNHHPDMIHRVIDEVASDAATLGSDHLTMLVHRSRALLAGSDRDAHHHFVAALDYGEAADRTPLEYARTQLGYGEWLRRQRRIVDARVQLSAALSTFESRNALPWAQRTRAELRAAGVQLSSPTTSTAPELALTPQELQIARLAASGLSNRQIADHIYVSHRTVAAHLYKIFPKMGITSRNQLRDALDDDDSRVEE